MKVYLASWFASKDEMSKRATELRENGIEVTARWIDENIKGTTQIKDVSEKYLRTTAAIDLNDILIANAVVLNVPSATDLQAADIPLASWARGGRHFEAGFQYATMMFYHNLPRTIRDRGIRQLIIVGHKENVFHYLDSVEEQVADNMTLPEILTFETWDLAKDYLVKVSKEEPEVQWQ